jgi:hypothetical protein
LSISSLLTPRPAVLPATPCSRFHCRAARSTSACAAATCAWACAVAQPQQGLLAYAGVRARLLELKRERARIQAGKDFSGADAVAFLHAHLRDAVAAVEGQRNLPDIDIAVERQSIRIVGGPVPGPDRGGDGYQDHSKD